MGNIVVLAKTLKKCYSETLERMTEDRYYRNPTKLESDFFTYLYQQIGFQEFEQKLKEREELINQYKRKVEIEGDTTWHIDFNLTTNTTRINNAPYSLSKDLSDELHNLVIPLTVSIERLYVIASKDKKDAAAIVGSNWKFKKIFPTFQATKQVNPRLVVSNETIDELINNYFLALKFGATLKEIS